MLRAPKGVTAYCALHTAYCPLVCVSRRGSAVKSSLKDFYPIFVRNRAMFLFVVLSDKQKGLVSAPSASLR